MGMFAYVRYEANCFECGEKIAHNWQTKDPDELYLQTVEPREVRNFYALCECGAWNEYVVVPVGGVEIRRVKP